MMKILLILTILLCVDIVVGLTNNSLTIQCAGRNLESVQYKVRKESAGVCILNLYVVDNHNKLLNKHDLCTENTCVYVYNTTTINDCMLSIDCDQQLIYYYKFDEYPRSIEAGAIVGIVISSIFYITLIVSLIISVRGS